MARGGADDMQMQMMAMMDMDPMEKLGNFHSDLVEKQQRCADVINRFKNRLQDQQRRIDPKVFTAFRTKLSDAITDFEHTAREVFRQLAIDTQIFTELRHNYDEVSHQTDIRDARDLNRDEGVRGDFLRHLDSCLQTLTSSIDRIADEVERDLDGVYHGTLPRSSNVGPDGHLYRSDELEVYDDQDRVEDIVSAQEDVEEPLAHVVMPVENEYGETYFRPVVVPVEAETGGVMYPQVVVPMRQASQGLTAPVVVPLRDESGEVSYPEVVPLVQPPRQAIYQHGGLGSMHDLALALPSVADTNRQVSTISRRPDEVYYPQDSDSVGFSFGYTESGSSHSLDSQQSSTWTKYSASVTSIEVFKGVSYPYNADSLTSVEEALFDAHADDPITISEKLVSNEILMRQSLGEVRRLIDYIVGFVKTGFRLTRKYKMHIRLMGKFNEFKNVTNLPPGDASILEFEQLFELTKECVKKIVDLPKKASRREIDQTYADWLDVYDRIDRLICQNVQSIWAPIVYSDQAWMQDLLHNNPSLIPVPTPTRDQDEPPKPLQQPFVYKDIRNREQVKDGALLYKDRDVEIRKGDIVTFPTWFIEPHNIRQLQGKRNMTAKVVGIEDNQLCYYVLVDGYSMIPLRRTDMLNITAGYKPEFVKVKTRSDVNSVKLKRPKGARIEKLFPQKINPDRKIIYKDGDFELRKGDILDLPAWMIPADIPELRGQSSMRVRLEKHTNITDIYFYVILEVNGQVVERPRCASVIHIKQALSQTTPAGGVRPDVPVPSVSTQPVRALKLLYKDADIEIRKCDIITLPADVVSDLPPGVEGQSVIKAYVYSYDPQFKEIFVHVFVNGRHYKKKSRAAISDIKPVWFECGNPASTL